MIDWSKPLECTRWGKADGWRTANSETLWVDFRDQGFFHNELYKKDGTPAESWWRDDSSVLLRNVAEPFKVDKPGRYRTRGGEIALVADFSGLGPPYVWLGTVNEGFKTWTGRGEYRTSEPCHHLDLIEYLGPLDKGLSGHKPLKQERKPIETWVNIYAACPTREMADHYATPGRLACVKVTFTDGEGL